MILLLLVDHYKSVELHISKDKQQQTHKIGIQAICLNTKSTNFYKISLISSPSSLTTTSEHQRLLRNRNINKVGINSPQKLCTIFGLLI